MTLCVNAARLLLCRCTVLVVLLLLLGCVFAGNAHAQSGLVAAWGFDEGAGTTVADASGNNNTGTLSDATWTSQGRFGNALSFNGTSALVLVNNSASLQLTTGMTLEAWVYPTTTLVYWKALIQKEADAYLLTASSNQHRPAAGGTLNGDCCPVVYAAAPLAVNTWTHVAATYDGSQLRMYTNGVLVSSAPASGSFQVNTNPLRIGGNTYASEFFPGRLDEVRIYNRALSQAEIQADMNTAVGAPDATLPTVTITGPTGGTTYATNGSPLTLAGTAGDNVAVTQVTWANDRGSSGTATGTATWSAAGITLQPGTNVLTVTARGDLRSDGAHGWHHEPDDGSDLCHHRERARTGRHGRRQRRGDSGDLGEQPGRQRDGERHHRVVGAGRIAPAGR
jgi:hypothetical protein